MKKFIVCTSERYIGNGSELAISSVELTVIETNEYLNVCGDRTLKKNMGNFKNITKNLLNNKQNLMPTFTRS